MFDIMIFHAQKQSPAHKDMSRAPETAHQHSDTMALSVTDIKTVGQLEQYIADVNSQSEDLQSETTFTSFATIFLKTVRSAMSAVALNRQGGISSNDGAMRR